MILGGANIEISQTCLHEEARKNQIVLILPNLKQSMTIKYNMYVLNVTYIKHHFNEFYMYVHGILHVFTLV